MPSDPRHPPTHPRTELPRRFVDVAGAAPRRAGAAPSSSRPEPEQRQPDRRLIVGLGISLNGEIRSCDHLIVEGTVEAQLKDCRAIDLSGDGTFKGSAEVDDAVIAGRFEGDLMVRGRLVLRSSGVVSGTLRYGEIEIETGGKVIGTMEPLESVVTPIRDPAKSPESVREGAG